MKYTKSFKPLSILALTLSLSYCASELDKSIENARFLLDKGEYSQVVTDLTPVVAANPNSLEAKFLLAASQVAFVVVGDHNSYLTLFANFLEDKQGTESDFATFARLSPSGNQLTDLHSALLMLQDIANDPDLTDPSDIRRVFLQLYMTRLFEIGGVVKTIHANNPDLICNASPGDPQKDGVPDGFDPSLASNAQLIEFQDDLGALNGDGDNAGFGSTFSMRTRMLTISAALNTAGDAITFLNTAFGAPGDGSPAPCNVPK